MRNFLRKRSGQIIIYILLDLLSITMGMGVPFFTILLGFPIGFLIPTIIADYPKLTPAFLRSILRISLIASMISFLLLAAIWLPSLSWMFDPSRDLADYGMPMILYAPLASFIGWIVLMVVISPFLQFLMALFGSITRLVISRDPRKSNRSSVGKHIAA